MRVLVASTQGAGHFHPLVPFVESALRQGHEVLVVVPPALAEAVEARGYPLRVGARPPEDELGAIWSRVPSLSAEDANRVVIGEIFARLDTEAMLPALREACAEWRPDLVLRELNEYASAVAAEEAGIPQARVAIGLAATEAFSLAIAGPVLERFRAGLGERLRDSPFLTPLPESFDRSPFPRTLRVRDSTPPAAAPHPLPAWPGREEQPLVYVTFGSVAGGLPGTDAAYRAALDAVAPLPVRALLTLGAADPNALGPVPENVRAEAWVPQADVLAHAAAVVGHGGFGTTVGTLAAGLPSVLVPLFADQPHNARRVEEAGAGLTAQPDATSIRRALKTVLGDASYRDAAARLAAEMRALPPADGVLAELVA